MTANLVETLCLDQDLDQGLPTMQGRALIAWGNGGHVGEHGVPANDPGFFFPRGANQTVGFQDERLMVAGAGCVAIGCTHDSIFDASGSIVLQGNFMVYYDDVSSADWFKQSLISYNCGTVSIDAGVRFDPNRLNAMLAISSKHMQTHTGYTTYGGSGGTHAVTGVGFQPDMVFFWFAGPPFFGDPPIATYAGLLSIGCADGNGNQWGFGTEGIVFVYGGAFSVGTSRGSASQVVVSRTHPGVSHVSMDADGFTLDYDGANGGIVGYWAIKDPSGEFSCGISNDGDATIPTGFKPDAVLFANSCTTALDTDQSGKGIGFGGSDNQLRQFSGWAAQGSTSSSRAARYWNTSALSMTSDRGDPLHAAVVEAQATAFNTTNVDLSWTGPTTGTRYFGWAALKTGVGPGFEGCGSTQQIYRWLKR